MGKIIRKDYLLTAVEIVKKETAKRGKTFYRDNNTTPYDIVLLRL